MSIDNQIHVLVIGIVLAIIISAYWITCILESHSSDYESEKEQKDNVWKGILTDEEIKLMRQESEWIEVKKRSDAYRLGFKRGLHNSMKGDDE